MSTVPTSDHLKEEFMALYSADFEITGGDLMQFFPWTEDPVVQKQYRSIVAKVPFAAHWV